jgi:hypothetical protein
MQQSPGFVRSLACRYLGNMTQYAWLRTWGSSEDHVAFRQTEPAKAFAKTRPDGLYWPLATGIAPDGHWQSVLESGDIEPGGGYLLRMAFSVPKDAGEAFVHARAMHDEIALASSGVTSAVTFESQAEPDERTFLSLIRMSDLAAYRNFAESQPDTLALGPNSGAGTLLVTECYEIVEELRGDGS